MKFAERMKLLAPSATFAVNTKALELKAKGIQVISLAVGEPYLRGGEKGHRREFLQIYARERHHGISSGRMPLFQAAV